MGNVWKKGAAIALAAVMCAGALSGCGKKSEALTAFSFNGKKVDGDLANFVLRYEQSAYDDIYAYYGSMMQQDIWSMDNGQGLGITTWDDFKSTIGEEIEKLLLAEEHAADYDVSLTDDEKKAITDAAAKFIADNDEAALASMSASQEVVERFLTLSTIRTKVEDGMTADVDTNVPDEEAAQRTVEYIRYTPTTEAQTEAESEMAGTEAEAENTAMTEAEQNPEMTEGETSVVETEPAEKTKSSGETEVSKIQTEAEMAVTEAEQDAEEAESEDPAMAEARERYSAMAEEELEALKSGSEDFETASARISAEGISGVTASSFTFGKDDTYPDAAIIEATNDLEDDTLVDKLVKVGDSWYILYVKDAFDEDATASKKESIVEERKTEKINEVYEEWMADTKFEVDSEKLGKLLKERSYTAPEVPETEAPSVTSSAVETELHPEVTHETGMAVETEPEA